MEEKIIFLLLINITLSLSYSFLKDKEIYTRNKLKSRIWYGKEDSNKFYYRIGEDYRNIFGNKQEENLYELEERRKRDVGEVNNTTEGIFNMKTRSLFSDVTEIPRNITIVNPSRIEVFSFKSSPNSIENSTPSIEFLDTNVTKETEYNLAVVKTENAVPFFEVIPNYLEKLVLDDNITDMNDIVDDVITGNEDQNTIGKQSHIKIITTEIKQNKSVEQTNEPDGKYQISKINFVSENKLLRIISVLAATFKKIITQHEHVKKMHRDVMFASKELMSKRTELLKKLAEFDKKYKRLISRGSHLAALQYTLATKQEMFLKKENDFLNKRREFEDLKKQLANQQRRFHKLQKMVLDMKGKNDTFNHSPTVKSANNSGVVKNKNFKMPAYVENTEKSLSSLETSASKSVNKVAEMLSKHKIKSYYRDILNEKDYIDIDDIVRKFYFNDTSKKAKPNCEICNCCKNNKKSKNNVTPIKLQSKPHEEKASTFTLNILNASNDKYPITKMLNGQELNPKPHEIKARLELVNITAKTNTRNGISSILSSDLKDHEKIVLQSILNRNRRWINPAVTEEVPYKIKESAENMLQDVSEKVKEDKNDIMDVLCSKFLNISKHADNNNNFTTDDTTDFNIADFENVFNAIEEIAHERNRVKKNSAMQNFIMDGETEMQTMQNNTVQNIQTTTNIMIDLQNNNFENNTAMSENKEVMNNEKENHKMVNDNSSGYKHVSFTAPTSDVMVVTANSIENFEIRNDDTTEHNIENNIINNINNIYQVQSEKTIYLDRNNSNIVKVLETCNSENINNQNNIADENTLDKGYLKSNNQYLGNNFFENIEFKNKNLVFNTEQNADLQNNKISVFESQAPLVNPATDVMDLNSAVELLNKQILDKTKTETKKQSYLNENQNLENQVPHVDLIIRESNYNDVGIEQQLLEKILLVNENKINENQSSNLINSVAANPSISYVLKKQVEQNATMGNENKFIYQNDTALNPTINAIDINIVTESHLLEDSEEGPKRNIHKNNSFNHQVLAYIPTINIDVELKNNCSDELSFETEIDDQNSFILKPISNNGVVEIKNIENKDKTQSESKDDNEKVANLKTYVKIIAEGQAIEMKNAENISKEHVYTNMTENSAHEKRSTEYAKIEKEPSLNLKGIETSDNNNDEKVDSGLQRMWKTVVKIMKKIFHKAKSFVMRAWKGNDKDRNLK